VEGVRGSRMPQECFISIRVGETQKLSRLCAGRSYHFPTIAEGRRIGKLEVFQRIGECNVDVDVSNPKKRDTSVDCSDAGFGRLQLKMGVISTVGKVIEPDTGPESPRTKLQSAKDYLTKHGLEMKLSEVVQEVLREKPDRPFEFLAEKFLGGAIARSGGLPKLAGAHTPVAESRQESLQERWKPPPSQFDNYLMESKPKESHRLESVAELTMNASYFKPHFRQMPEAAWSALHAQFSARVMPSADGPIHVEKATTSPRWGEKSGKPPLARQQAIDGSYYIQQFCSMPTQGWSAIHGMFPPRTVVRSPQLPEPPGQAWSLSPSVGTWLAHRRNLPVDSRAPRTVTVPPVASKPKARGKIGASALMNALKSGEVAGIVDQMEATQADNEAKQAGKSICVICGPSGAGKSTLIKRLMADFPGRFGFSVSHTTRGPRAGEKNGVDYHFVPKEEMQRRIALGEFVEHAEVHGNFYGTSVAGVEAVTKQGQICLLDIDVQGADTVRKSSLHPSASYMFLSPPSLAILEMRLRGRGTETEEKIMKRLAGAAREMAVLERSPDAWHCKIVNDSVDRAYVDFRCFLADFLTAAPKQTYRLRPSVGTWLSQLIVFQPNLLTQPLLGLHKATSGPIAARAKDASWSHSPSIGTWLSHRALGPPLL